MQATLEIQQINNNTSMSYSFVYIYYYACTIHSMDKIRVEETFIKINSVNELQYEIFIFEKNKHFGYYQVNLQLCQQFMYDSINYNETVFISLGIYLMLHMWLIIVRKSS